MPELPEVETIRIGLQSLVVSKRIVDLHFDNAKSFPNPETLTKQHLLGHQIMDVRRRGKVLFLDLDNNYSLLVHLKMTGQLVYLSDQQRFGGGHPNDSLINQLPDKSTRVEIVFSDNSRLFFNDQRKFGWMKLYKTDTIDELDFFNKLGPEPLSQDFSWQILKQRLSQHPNALIKPTLLDQSTIAGVGNIYADESLFKAKIHPASRVKDLNDQDFKRLFKSLRDVLQLSLDQGGSSDRNYVNAEGKKGSYLQFAKVFRRENQACPRCKGTIIKIKLAGRGTHICPTCQVIATKKV